MADIVDKLKGLSRERDPLDPVTVRLPANLHKEMKEFCANHRIRFSVLAREAIRLGFEEINRKSTEE